MADHLPYTGRSEKERIRGVGNESQRSQLSDLTLVDGRLKPEIELLEGTVKGQVRQPRLCPQVPGVPQPRGAQQVDEQVGVDEYIACGKIEELVDVIEVCFSLVSKIQSNSS